MDGVEILSLFFVMRHCSQLDLSFLYGFVWIYDSEASHCIGLNINTTR
jgi:hypothetical protein